MRPGIRYLAAPLVLITMAACTGGSAPKTTIPSASARPSSVAAGPQLAGGDDESSAPNTITPSKTTPAPALSSPGAAAEVDGTCPYISTADFSAYEGDHVGRVTLIQTKPVGCRFYFYYQPTTAIVGEVLLQVFTGATPKIADTDAFDAMVRASAGHPERQSSASIGDGAIAFKTMLQGADTWQCLVTVGNKVYTVRTRQPYPAKNAFNLATAVVATVN